MQMTITANNPKEMKQKIAEVYKLFFEDDKSTETNPQMEFDFTRKNETEKPAAEKKPKQKKETKKEVEEHKGNGLDTDAPIAVSFGGENISENKTYTKADATEALQNVMTENGVTAVKAILAKFGAAKVSDIEETKYKDLILACLDLQKGH